MSYCKATTRAHGAFWCWTDWHLAKRPVVILYTEEMLPDVLTDEEAQSIADELTEQHAKRFLVPGEELGPICSGHVTAANVHEALRAFLEILEENGLCLQNKVLQSSD